MSNAIEIVTQSPQPRFDSWLNNFMNLLHKSLLVGFLSALANASSLAQPPKLSSQTVAVPQLKRVLSLQHAPETGDIAALQSEGDDRFIQTWNSTGREKWRVSIPQDGVYAMSFGRRGKVLAVGGAATKAWMRERRSQVTNQGTVRVLDARGGRVMRLLQCAPRGYIHSIAVAPDAPLLAVAGHSWIELWNYSTSQRLTTFRTNGEVTSLDFSSDGRFLASAQLWKPPAVWNLKTRKLAFELPRQPNQNQSFVVAFSPQSDTLASAGFSFLNLHTLSKPHLKWSVTQNVGLDASYDVPLSSLDFSLDGKLLSVSGIDTQIVSTRDGSTKGKWEDFTALRFGKQRLWVVNSKHRSEEDSLLSSTLFASPIRNLATPPKMAIR